MKYTKFFVGFALFASCFLSNTSVLATNLIRITETFLAQNVDIHDPIFEVIAKEALACAADNSVPEIVIEKKINARLGWRKKSSLLRYASLLEGKIEKAYSLQKKLAATKNLKAQTPLLTQNAEKITKLEKKLAIFIEKSTIACDFIKTMDEYKSQY